MDVGTVSHGTLRSEDLIETFMEELSHRSQPSILGFRMEWANELSGIDSYDDIDAETRDHMVESLFDRLNDCAPEGYYFGAHPGDGSDFGFWSVEE